MTTAREPNLYSPLDVACKEIRLLEIVSVSPRLVLSLQVVSLDDNPEFFALSYVWGDPANTTDIVVDGIELSVTQNLVNAIKDIQRHWATNSLERRLLWADAVCINQGDNDEKSNQVPLMREMYSGAQKVLAWLGVADDSTDRAFDILRQAYTEMIYLGDQAGSSLQWMERYPDLCRIDLVNGVDIWTDITKLFYLPYWSRIWIFQELYLARDVVMISGTRSLSFARLSFVEDTFLSAVQSQPVRPNHIHHVIWTFLLKAFVNGRQMQRAHSIGVIRTLCEQVRQYPTSASDHLEGGSKNPAQAIVALYPSLDLHVWLVRYVGSALSATDQRDVIYALLGISGVPIKPDYQKPTLDVYMDFIKTWELWCSAQPRTYLTDLGLQPEQLWFLRTAGAATTTTSASYPGAPSWLPRFSSSLQARYQPRQQSLSTAAFFAGSGGPWRIEHAFLEVSAVHIDRMLALGVPLERGAWSNECERKRLIPKLLNLAIQRQDYPAIYDPALVVYTILTSEATVYTRQTDRPNVESFISYQILRTFNEIMDFRDYDEARSIFFPDLQFAPEQGGWSVLDFNRFLERLVVLYMAMEETEIYERGTEFLTNILPGRVFIARTETGYSGLFPPEMKEMDEVWLLKGYDGPVVLRRAEDYYYIYIGPCIVFNLLEERSETVIGEWRDSIRLIEIH